MKNSIVYLPFDVLVHLNHSVQRIMKCRKFFPGCLT